MARDMTQEQATFLVTYLNRAGLVIAMEGQGAVWHDALWGVRYEDGMEAVRNIVRRPRTGLISPGDVLAEVRKVRAARIGNRVPPAPPGDIPAEAQMDFHRAYMQALGDGADEDQADQAACRTVGASREALPPADPGRLKALLAGSLKGA
jgi:hypothetical protein